MSESLSFKNSVQKNKINLTGNPFVDTGLAVIAALAKLDDINDLTLDIIKKVHGDGSKITEYNSKLKSFTQLFGTNNSLFQTSYGYEKRRGPSVKNKTIYKNILKELLESIENPEDGSRCWACGIKTSFNFSDIYNNVIRKVTGRQVSENKSIGRDIFPLAGSLGSDAQALPAASISPQICAKCLFVIHYLPLGVILLNGRLAIFQCMSIEFWYDFMRRIVSESESRLSSGNYDTIGKKEGRNYIAIRLLSWFDEIQIKKRFDDIPDETSLYTWRFSNSGATPECVVEEIPNKALTFLWEAKQHGLAEEVKYLIRAEVKNTFYSLYDCIRDNREYSGLYPKNSKFVASQKFFSLYHMRILKRSRESLEIAYKIARNISESMSEKELKRFQRLDIRKDNKTKNKYRTVIIEMATRGEITLERYTELFTIKDGSGISVNYDGFNIIRFYLYHAKENFIAIENKMPIHNNSSKHDMLLFYASAIYNKNVEEIGLERFEKTIISLMGRDCGHLIKWLSRQFTKLAESEEGFDYRSWMNLCKLDGGRFGFELLFQLRLIWSYWASKKYAKVENIVAMIIDGNSMLPTMLDVIIGEVFRECLDKKGIDKFHKDVLVRLQRGELGLLWFKNKMVKGGKNGERLTEQEWDSFLCNAEGQNIKSERLLQLHLALANLYKVSSKAKTIGSGV